MIAFADMLVEQVTGFRDACLQLQGGDEPESGVHVDWEITADEWQQLRGVLVQHFDVEYIWRLAQAGGLGVLTDAESADWRAAVMKART